MLDLKFTKLKNRVVTPRCRHLFFMCRHFMLVFGYWLYVSILFEHVSTLEVAVAILDFVLSKLVVTSSLLEIFEHRLLCWKLDFQSYNLHLRIFSFGLVKTEIIPSEVYPRNWKKSALSMPYSFGHNFFSIWILVMISVPLEN